MCGSDKVRNESKRSRVRYKDMEGCYHCCQGGPLYLLLRFRIEGVTAFGLVKGETGHKSYDGNELDITLWEITKRVNRPTKSTVAHV